MTVGKSPPVNQTPTYMDEGVVSPNSFFKFYQILTPTLIHPKDKALTFYKKKK